MPPVLPEKFTPESPAFKQCTNCSTRWSSRPRFLADPDIEIIGYQVHFKRLEAGLFLFNHSCKGTFSIRAKEFRDLYTGPVFTERATGGDDCPGYCLRKDELRSCPALCECAYVREILQIVVEWPKGTSDRSQ